MTSFLKKFLESLRQKQEADINQESVQNNEAAQGPNALDTTIPYSIRSAAIQVPENAPPRRLVPVERKMFWACEG